MLKPGDSFNYLDKGYVKYLGHFGSDELIAKAARASFNSEAYKSQSANEALIDYLVQYDHSSPLEMGSITFESKMPLFVAAQHVRHRTFKLNQVSYRYVENDGDYYLVDAKDLCLQSTDNKQGRGSPLATHLAEANREIIEKCCDMQYKQYSLLVKNGVAKEIARGVLGSNFYTTIVWQADIRNLMNYLRLRLDGHAQLEIQRHAQIVEKIFAELFPGVYKSFILHVLRGRKFSQKEMDAILDLGAKGEIMYIEDTPETADKFEKEYGIKKSRFSTFYHKLFPDY
jgi:thymidylate synthase (FAD)